MNFLTLYLTDKNGEVLTLPTQPVAAPDAIKRRTEEIRQGHTGSNRCVRSRSQILADVECLLAHITLLAAPAAPASAPTCNYPNCKSEAEQQEIAAEVHAQLFGAPVEVVSVREAAQAVIDVALDEAMGRVHVCDRDNSDIKARTLSEEMQSLYRALQGKPEAPKGT